jgi:TorA maturation chaperone TorD
MDADAVAEEFDGPLHQHRHPLSTRTARSTCPGHLNDVPLAELRQDLARLGIARVRGVGEFEDHLGALCETMRVLIAGGPGIARQPLDEQKQLFRRPHRALVRALPGRHRGAEGANFYRVVAAFAGAFLAIEALAFRMWQPADSTHAA